MCEEDANKAVEIGLAIRDHYKPEGPADSLPSTLLGAKLAICDKLDTLQSLFAIGKIPTGSKDPYALRRAALGIIRIIIDRKMDINLQHASGMSIQLKDFILTRFRNYMLSLSYDARKIDKAISEMNSVNSFNIYKTYLLINEKGI